MNCFFRHTLLRPAVFAALLIAVPALGDCAPRAPAPKSYVNDTAGVIDAGAAVRLNSILADLDAKAGAQLAVLTVKGLGGEDIETYAVRMFSQWGIGDKNTDRGLLLLVAVDERKSRIEVGYGLEGILPDGLTGAIQDKYMLPYFKEGDYSQGVFYGALALASVVAEDSGVPLSGGAVRARTEAPPSSPARKLLSLLLLFGFIVFAIRHPYLALFLLSSMARGGGGGFGGGGFGGFGGGSSGGGGSSRSW